MNKMEILIKIAMLIPILIIFGYVIDCFIQARKPQPRKTKKDQELEAYFHKSNDLLKK